MEVQEYIHRKNGDVETGNYTELDGEVRNDSVDDLVDIFRDIESRLIPPPKPLNALRSMLIDGDPETEGRKVLKRVYSIYMWTSLRGSNSYEKVVYDLDPSHEIE